MLRLKLCAAATFLLLSTFFTKACNKQDIITFKTENGQTVVFTVSENAPYTIEGNDGNIYIDIKESENILEGSFMAKNAAEDYKALLTDKEGFENVGEGSDESGDTYCCLYNSENCCYYAFVELNAKEIYLIISSTDQDLIISTTESLDIK